MNLLQRYIDYIKKNTLFQQNDHLLIAVSGGIDSVVLCHLCKHAGLNFSIAHCNFNLRGVESMRDEEFTEALAEKLAVPFYVKHFNTAQYAGEHKVSIQVAARELRYSWFYEILDAQSPISNSRLQPHHSPLTTHHSPAYLLTAHHLDDNVETLLMNLFKGTGIGGLRGIDNKRNRLIRPLLFATKEEITEYATTNGLEWVQDSSNNEVKYTRNYVRHEIMPVLENANPRVKRNIAETIARLGEAEMLYQQAIDMHKKKLLEPRDDEVHIPVLKLSKAVPLKTIIYEVIKDYGFASQQVGEVLKLLQAGTGKYIQSTSHRILRNRAWIIISPLREEAQQIILIEKEEKQKNFDGKKLLLKTVSDIPLSNDPLIAIINAKEIKFPLLLRRWKEGDYFYPLGMKKKKKLARFFIDQKASKNEKEGVWVIESNRRIVWIIGFRIDDRFKVSAHTKEALCLSVSNL